MEILAETHVDDVKNYIKAHNAPSVETISKYKSYVDNKLSTIQVPEEPVNETEFNDDFEPMDDNDF